MMMVLKLSVIFLFAFLFHFLWEIWQISFYKDMINAPHAQAVWFCTRATAGDALMATVAYALAGVAARRFDWLLQPTFKPCFLYFSIGLGLTIVFEHLATNVWGRWTYSEAMPRLPLLGTGLLPVLQWIVVPAITLLISRVFWRGLQCRL